MPINAYVCRLPDYVQVGIDQSDYVTVNAMSEQGARIIAARSGGGDGTKIEDPEDIAIVAVVPLSASVTEPQRAHPDVVRELEIIVDQMEEWIEKLGPIVKAGGPFQPMLYLDFCCGVHSSFEGMVSTAREELAKHEQASTEPVTITFWSEGAPVIHDVVGIPPGISIVFHDLDCESAGDDAEIKNDPQMGDYFVFGPYTATT